MAIVAASMCARCRPATIAATDRAPSPPGTAAIQWSSNWRTSISWSTARTRRPSACTPHGAYQ
eukprot:7560591-Pyramimonas_sp.AAC.1